MTMPPVELNPNDQKEQISLAYLYAISALAGYGCQEGPRQDRNTVDAFVWPGERIYNINVQLKATASPKWHEDGLHIQLSCRTYNALRTAMGAAILVVFELPSEKGLWFECDVEGLLMRKCAWWLSLKNCPAIDTASRVVTIPKTHHLDVDELKRLMGLASQGRL